MSCHSRRPLSIHTLGQPSPCRPAAVGDVPDMSRAEVLRQLLAAHEEALYPPPNRVASWLRGVWERHS